MSWIRDLCDVYDRNEKIAGVYTEGRYGEPLILVPIYHSTMAAHVTITIDDKGNFIRADKVPKNQKMTLVPVTEKSATRSNNIAPMPLCDYLRYVAGDFLSFVPVGSLKGNDSECFPLYLNQLKASAESEYSHPKVRAVYAYIEKACMTADLIEAGILKTTEDGRLDDKEKIEGALQRDIFVRFQVVEDIVSPDDAAPENRPDEDKCWMDRSLQEAHIAYEQAGQEDTEISYVSGETGQITYLHPKKIRTEGDGTKLISANLAHGGDLKRRFGDKELNFAVTYEESQKAHNALKWLIRRQGKNFGSLCIVAWNKNMEDFPDWELPLGSGKKDEKAKEVSEKDQEKSFTTGDLILRAMMGLEELHIPSSEIRLMAFDSVSDGRLAIINDEHIDGGRYIEHIKKWQMDAGWIFFENGESIYRAPSIREIARALYGEESSKGYLELLGGNVGQDKEVCRKLLPCILYGVPLPADYLRLAVNRASTPLKYKKQWNWRQTLNLACAFVKKYYLDKGESIDMALDSERDDRSYLYGRLLAVADCMEFRTFDSGDPRETNAKRYMTEFSHHPFRTWRIIEERARIYLRKLNIPERIQYEKLLQEICAKFKAGEFEKNTPLDGLYLLGYNHQMYEFYNRKKTEKEEETDNE